MGIDRTTTRLNCEKEKEKKEKEEQMQAHTRKEYFLKVVRRGREVDRNYIDFVTKKERFIQKYSLFFPFQEKRFRKY